MKKNLFGLMFFLILLIALPMHTQAKIKLNKTSVTIAKKKTAQLKLIGTKKKIKWTSSNKKIATVTQKGKVKAKKIGKCTVTAKIGKKKYKCKITVVPSKVNEIVYNANGVKVTYTGTFRDDYGITVKFMVKNSNKFQIGLMCNGFIVDGYTIQDPTLYEVYPNTSILAEYLIPKKYLNKYGIKTIKIFKAYMDICDDSYDSLYTFRTKNLVPTLQ